MGRLLLSLIRKYNLIILCCLIFFIALFLRIFPVIKNSTPISYDAPFHINVASKISLEENILKSQINKLKVDNTYPPLYHILIVILSKLSFVSIFDLARFILPFFASLLCIPSFLLAKRTFKGDNSKALLLSLFIAIMPFLVSNSYDSPENIALFVLFSSLLLVENKNYFLAGFFYVLVVFFNYLLFFFTLPIFFIVNGLNKRFFVGFIFSLFLLLIFNLLTSGYIIPNYSLNTGLDFVTYNLRNLLPLSGIFILSISLVVYFFYLSYNKYKSKTLDFFFYFSVVSNFCIFSMFITNILRPWEHLKFVSISLLFLSFSFYNQNLKKIFSLFLFFLLTFSLLLSFQSMFPRISVIDKKAIDFLSKVLIENDKVLAEPSFSEYISYYNSHLRGNLVTSLHYENTPQRSLASESLVYLVSKEKFDKNFLVKNNIKYLIFNYEDFILRNAEEFYSFDYLDKIYSLSYFVSCPFPMIPKQMAYSCYDNETVILKHNFR